MVGLILGTWMIWTYNRSNQVQRDRHDGEAYARAAQQAVHAGQALPQMPARVATLRRPAPSGQPAPPGGWWPVLPEPKLKLQQIKIMMDVYTNMQRRLEHYRQLGITLVFGFFALFSLIDAALFKGDGRHDAAEGVAMEALIVLAVWYGHHLLAMVRKNFEEIGGIVQRIERWTGMFEPATLFPGGPLLPADWPSGDDARDRAEFRQVGWLDDIIPRTQKIILLTGWLEAVYVWHEYGSAILRALPPLRLG
jgi:hypothetical protein